MDSYERTSDPGAVLARATGGHLDWDTGRFAMILATEGEASDGHILSIRGAQVPDRIPLLVQHQPTPMLPALGSVVEMKPRGKKLPAVGWVELDDAALGGRAREPGEAQPAAHDALAPIRRGYAHMIDSGHLGAVSVRWEGDGVPRSSLKPSHPHYVDAQDESRPMPQRYGLFFAEWAPREGSVVGVGADPMATIREQAAGEEDPIARVYWQALIRAHEADQECPDILAASALVSEGAGMLRDAGLEPLDLQLALVNFGGLDGAPLDIPLVPCTLRDGRVEYVSRELHDELTGESLAAFREATRLTLGREVPALERQPEPPVSQTPRGTPEPTPTPVPDPAVQFARELASPEGIAALTRGLGSVARGAVTESWDRAYER